MLILAGVSINAVVGDNGILTKTQYASFLNEMAAVEEAVQLWKTGEVIEEKGEESKAIPANGLCKANELMNTERLVGEVGYYRTWSIGETAPTTDILSDASTFNSAFESELVFYPAGVQDLYYLNNDALEIKGNKTYLIDAATGMIYSMTGIGLKGVRCYSSNMAKAVMNGESTAPLFAEAEVSGTGENIVYAGSEYLMDKNGNYIDENGNIVSEENKVINEYGFKIIGNTSNVNIYKLYNNGDLYGKGVKGYLLNTPEEEMIGLDESLYETMIFQNNIPGINTKEFKLIPGYRVMYIIDKNKELWAWGNNYSNKLGLTTEEKITFSGYEAKKINIYNKKVVRVLPTQNQTFVIVENGSQYELYACGNNQYGQLGVGNLANEENCFKKVEFENPQNIISIAAGYDNNILILTEENSKKELYYAGYSNWRIFLDSELYSNNCTIFKKISDYTSLFNNKNIMNVYAERNLNYLLIIDKVLYSFDGNNLVEMKFGEQSAICEKVSIANYWGIAKIKINDENQIWYLSHTREANYVGTDEVVVNNWTRVDTYFPNGITGNDIKDFYVGIDRIGSGRTTITYLTNDGKIFGSGQKWALGIGITSDTERSNGFEVIDYLPKIDSFVYDSGTNGVFSSGSIPLKSVDGQYYMTGNGKLAFNEKILQTNWKLIAQNVKVFNAKTNSSKNALAYIDNNNDVWVLGENGINIGLENNNKYRNFVRLKDYYVETDKYSKIDGKIEDYGISYSSIYFKTNESDGNSVYIAGEEFFITGSVSKYNGITLLINNIEKMQIGLFAKHFITTDKTWFSMGSDIGRPGSETPQRQELSIDVQKVSDFYDGTYGQYILEDGKLYGLAVGGVMSGHDPETNVYTLINPSEFGNERIISVAAASNATIALTESGKLYGWGLKTYLGMNESNSSIRVSTPQLITGISDVVSVIPSYGYSGNMACAFIAIKKDGTVWGTGSNANGILGRWKGASRLSINSRYQTAFEWVECPELEI